jgi:hypothetical protein
VFELPFCTLAAIDLEVIVSSATTEIAALAVNVTDVPTQIEPDGEAEMLNCWCHTRFTDIVIVFEFAVLVVRQPPPVIVNGTGNSIAVAK